jgi:hypothetical protein
VVILSFSRYVHRNTQLFFIPLNPPPGSWHAGHYFAANEIFWDALFDSGLIDEPPETKPRKTQTGETLEVQVIKEKWADEIIFGGRLFNHRKWTYSILDLAPDIIEAKSEKAAKQLRLDHFQVLLSILQDYRPSFAVLMHGVVWKKFVSVFLRRNGLLVEKEEQKCFQYRTAARQRNPKRIDVGPIGKVLRGLDTFFYYVPFPSKRNGDKAEHANFWTGLAELMEQELVGAQNRG